MAVNTFNIHIVLYNYELSEFGGPDLHGRLKYTSLNEMEENHSWHMYFCVAAASDIHIALNSKGFCICSLPDHTTSLRCCNEEHLTGERVVPLHLLQVSCGGLPVATAKRTYRLVTMGTGY